MHSRCFVGSGYAPQARLCPLLLEDSVRSLIAHLTLSHGAKLKLTCNSTQAHEHQTLLSLQVAPKIDKKLACTFSLTLQRSTFERLESLLTLLHHTKHALGDGSSTEAVSEEQLGEGWAIVTNIGRTLKEVHCVLIDWLSFMLKYEEGEGWAIVTNIGRTMEEVRCHVN